MESSDSSSIDTSGSTQQLFQIHNIKASNSELRCSFTAAESQYPLKNDSTYRALEPPSKSPKFFATNSWISIN
jgi:hypothetical protein